jgi:hypothetical protein
MVVRGSDSFLRLDEFVAVLDDPVRKCAHRPVGEGPSQRCQRVIDSRRCFGIRPAVDEAAVDKAIECLGERLVTDAADIRAQRATTLRAGGESGHDHRIPHMREQVRCRTQAAVRHEFQTAVVDIARHPAIVSWPTRTRGCVTIRSVRIGLSMV